MSTKYQISNDKYTYSRSPRPQIQTQYSVSGTFINYGSKFRPPSVLEPLLLHHPNWPKCEELLRKGSRWPLHELPDSDCAAKIREFIQRDNHKSAIKYIDAYHAMIIQEIQRGWMIPLPHTYINNRQYRELASVGIDDSQWSISPDATPPILWRVPIQTVTLYCFCLPLPPKGMNLGGKVRL